MKSIHPRMLAAAVLALLTWILLAAATSGPVLQPDKLVLVSTTDVKGKTGPCG